MLKLQNTLTGQLEKFVALNEKQVRMYACGPTVYDFAHIGNFRTFIFIDLLRRYLKYRGYDVYHVMNITDIEDKIIKKSVEANEEIESFTSKYLNYFLEDMKSLEIQTPEKCIRATGHIPEMIELVKNLLNKDSAYISDGSVYFRVSSFKNYGKLSGAKLSGNRAGARVDIDEYDKDDVRDFVLWKGARSGEPSWNAEFGAGRPGWHLECSAMSMKYLGETFDIHCGGVDLVFPHHENEIAQSEAATNRPFVKYWLHAEHLQINGRKMSKREGNYYTLRDLIDLGYSPLAVRYVLASVPYRKPLNFTLDVLQSAERRVEKLNDFYRRVYEAQVFETNANEILTEINKAQTEFEASMDDDLNTARALAAVTMLESTLNRAISTKQLNKLIKETGIKLLENINSVLGLFKQIEEDLLDEEIKLLIEERSQSKINKNFARADEIRSQLLQRGIILEDTRDGVRWKQT